MRIYLPLPVGARVTVTKHAACNNPAVEPGSWDHWVAGGWDNTGSFPVDYKMRGVLLAPIRVGEWIFLFRTMRNGVASEGIFLSTKVQKILSPDEALTQNSVYRIARIQTD